VFVHPYLLARFWDEIQAHLTWYDIWVKDYNMEIRPRLTLDMKVGIESYLNLV